MSFANRAKALRSKKAVREQELRQKQLNDKGCTQEEYWKTQVHSIEDVVKYYQIYFPSYPQQLCEALALRLEEIRVKDPQDKYVRQYDKDGKEVKTSTEWDFEEELKKQKTEGQINNTYKRMAELVLD